MTWVGRPKSLLPRERIWQQDTHTQRRHKCGCRGGFEPCWCCYLWSPGVQAIIIPIIIHPSWGRFNGPKERGYTSERFEGDWNCANTQRSTATSSITHINTNTPLHKSLIEKNKAAAGVKGTDTEQVSKPLAITSWVDQTFHTHTHVHFIHHSEEHYTYILLWATG